MGDPKLDVLRPLIDSAGKHPRFARSVLNSLDAVDPLRRALDADPLRCALDPSTPEHEAMVERLAHVMVEARRVAMRPGFSSPELEPIPVTQARAVLAALREAAQ